MEICTVGSVRGERVGAATVDLNGHEAGNGGYGQGKPNASRHLSYSDAIMLLLVRAASAPLRRYLPHWASRHSCHRFFNSGSNSFGRFRGLSFCDGRKRPILPIGRILPKPFGQH